MADERFSKQAVQIAQIAATLYSKPFDDGGFASTQQALDEAFALVAQANKRLVQGEFDDD